MAHRRIVCRRRFLRGAGGFTLGLPFLPSLDSRAYAADPLLSHKPNMFALVNQHGGAFNSNFTPDDALLTDSMPVAPGHTIRWGRLQATDNRLSAIVRAEQLSERIVSKMNILHGLSIPAAVGHHTGCLGAFHRNTDQRSPDTGVFIDNPRPSIDQFAAYAPGVYDDNELNQVNRRRTMLVGGRTSARFNDPTAQSGEIVNVDSMEVWRSSLGLFDEIFVPPNDGEPQPERRPLIVDRVIETYRRLRNGNRRLSNRDRERLDGHMAMLDELERKLLVANASGPECRDIERPGEAADYFRAPTADGLRMQAQLHLDVFIAAFNCGTSRIAVYVPDYRGQATSFVGNWHQDVAHQWGDATAQMHMVGQHQFYFEHMLLYMAEKLDAIDTGDGHTLLDDSFLFSTNECGMFTHQNVNLQLTTFGAATGFFRTGYYVDYSNRGVPTARFTLESQNNLVQWLGLTYNQFLANVLLAMRVPRESFELWGHRGYGHAYIGASENWQGHYGTSVSSSPYFQMASDPLPVVT